MIKCNNIANFGRNCTSECNICIYCIYGINSKDCLECACNPNKRGRDMKENENNFTETQQKISDVCDNLKQFLIEKNRRYGNSALEPARIFSKADTKEQILVRCDDKINRIINSDKLRVNDLTDLMGYLVLLLVNMDITNFNDLLD